MLIGVGALCRISYSVLNYLYVIFSVLLTLAGDERANFLQSTTRNYSVRRDFLLVLRIGYVISLWHSLGLSCNYFVMG